MITNVPDNSKFMFSNGQSASNLVELAEITANLPDGNFSVHLNDSKNDFSTWVSAAVNDSLLADRLKVCTEKQQVVAAINNRIQKLLMHETVNQPELTKDPEAFIEKRKITNIPNPIGPPSELNQLDQEAELLHNFLSEERVIQQIKSQEFNMNSPREEADENVKETEHALSIFKKDSVRIIRNTNSTHNYSKGYIQQSYNAPQVLSNEPLRINEFFQMVNYCESCISKNNMNEASKVLDHLKKSKPKNPHHAEIFNDSLKKLQTLF